MFEMEIVTQKIVICVGAGGICALLIGLHLLHVDPVAEIQCKVFINRKSI